MPCFLLLRADFSFAFRNFSFPQINHILLRLNLLGDFIQLSLLRAELFVEFVAVGGFEDLFLADDLLEQRSDLRLVVGLHLLAGGGDFLFEIRRRFY